ncbi:hypothetical protein JMJ77_0001258 [Colletotrichum scovillei]|uniref:Uncharacterized protein n=1 Tax=Colletotrichum scovillei TaxID=1209932 RepID=A0A9P7UF25_9PEZI|nr:hypothetical protein JMJ77_0001258 [Colletotrichum scovillei]KAG7072484.1 hypothetical protein JMJ76_0005333 [Colletotrichum scovillei]KAG7080852.1 hypothetical protein JMJ78_0007936 [Colletotrichum scovillei]
MSLITRCIPPSPGPNQCSIVSGSATITSLLAFQQIRIQRHHMAELVAGCLSFLPSITISANQPEALATSCTMKLPLKPLDLLAAEHQPQSLRRHGSDLNRRQGPHFPDKKHVQRLIECRCRVISALETSENHVVEPTRLSLKIAVAYTMHIGQYSTHELLLEEGVECPCMFSKDERRLPEGFLDGDDTMKGLDSLPTCHAPGFWDAGSGCNGP